MIVDNTLKENKLYDFAIRESEINDIHRAVGYIRSSYKNQGNPDFEHVWKALVNLSIVLASKQEAGE